MAGIEPGRRTTEYTGGHTPRKRGQTAMVTRATKAAVGRDAGAVVKSFNNAFNTVATKGARQDSFSSAVHVHDAKAPSGTVANVRGERAITWSIDARGHISWNAPLESLMGYRPGETGFSIWAGSAPYAARNGDHHQDTSDHQVADLATSIVAPIATVVTEGAPWNFYQLAWTVEGPDGARHAVIVEATPTAPSITSTSSPRRTICTGVVRLDHQGPSFKDLDDEEREHATEHGRRSSERDQRRTGTNTNPAKRKSTPARNARTGPSTLDTLEDVRVHADDAGADDRSTSLRGETANWASCYRTLLDHTPDGVVIHDGSVIVYANRAVIHIAGEHGVTDILGKGIGAYVHPTSQVRLLERVAALKQLGDVGDPEEMLFQFPDGHLQKIETIPIFTTWNKKPAVQVLLRDISDRKRAEEMNRYQANLVSNMSDALISVDVAGNIVSWNQAAVRTYGWTAEEVIGKPVANVLSNNMNTRNTRRTSGHGTRAHGTRAPRRSRSATSMSADPNSANTLDDGPFSNGDRRHITKAGDVLQVRVSVAPLVGELEQNIGWVGICSDMTKFLRAEAERRTIEDRYTALTSVLGEGIVSFDDQGRVTEANDTANLLLGSRLDTQTSDAVLAGQHPIVSTSGSPLHVSDYPIASTLRTGEPVKSAVIGTMTDSGQRLWLSVNTRIVKSDGQNHPKVICSFADVTESTRAQQQLKFRINHDELTGLLNRPGFMDTLSKAINKPRHRPGGLALLAINLDGFKLLNDIHGPAIGDHVLTTIAQRLRAASRAGDTISRLGNDDFAVLCHDILDADSAVRIATALSAVIAEPITGAADESIIVSASIGVAFTEPEATSAEELLRDADTASSQARTKGPGHVEIFDAGIRDRVISRLQTYDELCRAVERHELAVFYQPIASLQEARVVGVEALMRWRHPSRGLVAPYDFIPLAEETGLIVAMGNWVLQQACSTMAEWRKSLPAAAHAHVSVNLSARQLAEPEIVSVVAAALEASGLPAEALMLEVTETALIDDVNAAASLLAELQHLGIKLAIDDFGTGYSSLGYLKNLPLDVLKIDRTFIMDIVKERADKAIVEAVVRLAHAFDLTVLAEGVETAHQRDTLRGLNCDLYQGYLLSKPVDTNMVTFRDSSPTTKLSGSAEPVEGKSEGAA